jgi:hypothetical protein
VKLTLAACAGAGRPTVSRALAIRAERVSRTGRW